MFAGRFSGLFVFYRFSPFPLRLATPIAAGPGRCPTMALSAKLVPNDALGALGAERDGLTSAEAAKRIEDGGEREEGDWQEL